MMKGSYEVTSGTLCASLGWLVSLVRPWFPQGQMSENHTICGSDSSTRPQVAKEPTKCGGKTRGSPESNSKE